MKVRWYIHDAHCLTMETGSGRTAPQIEWRSDALRRVSAGWNRPPERHTIERWLRGALPENGNLETFEEHALRTIAERGLEIGTGTIHDWAWGNAEWEYPGALRLEREEDAGRAREPDGYASVNEAEIGERLRRAADEADRVRAARRRPQPHRRSSLSGARGKITLHIDADGRTLAPTGRSLSTWIVKVENRPEWPGEAGVESVCQRTLAHLGLETAPTRARVIDGIPVVMSQRSDRTAQRSTVVATHQEDWLQAWGKGPGFKDDDHGPDHGYDSLYAIMRRYGDEAALGQITRLIAATCALCNGDLHRKNVALAHGPPDEPFRIRLAPVYDFSSQCGAGRTGDNLSIGVAGMIRAWEVDEARWRKLAERCRLDAGQTVAIAKEIAAQAPEALAAAREEGREDDEWKNPEAVERRLESTIKAARRYAQILGVRDAGRRTHEAPETTAPGTVAGAESQNDPKAQRAARIHNLRTRHHDPAVRANAHLHLAALAPSANAGARMLEEAVAGDAEIAQDPALKGALVKRTSEMRGGQSPSWTDDGIRAVEDEETRTQAHEAVQHRAQPPTGGRPRQKRRKPDDETPGEL